MKMKKVPMLAVTLTILAVAIACVGDGSTFGDFPENPGYLRATNADFGKLVIFNADTFEIYRTVDLPKALEGKSHRIERDDKGRIWIGYSQEYTGVLPWMSKEEVRVFSVEGEPVHTIQVNFDDEYCGPPEGGIAFSNGYAFIGCVSSGFEAKVVVVDTESMELIKTLEIERPHPEIPDFSDFFINSVEEVAGSILVFGTGHPPLEYDAVSIHWSPVTIVAHIDPGTLIVQDYKVELPPGSEILDVAEVGGMAWLLNSLSHIPEHPSRTDVYVMDPKTLELVDSFNLPSPFPKWGAVGTDGYVYVYHTDFLPEYDPARDTGVSRIDPATREVTYARFGVAPTTDAAGFGVYKGRPCIVSDTGLHCMNYDGSLELEIEQEAAIGVLFPPSSD